MTQSHLRGVSLRYINIYRKLCFIWQKYFQTQQSIEHVFIYIYFESIYTDGRFGSVFWVHGVFILYSVLYFLFSIPENVYIYIYYV